MRKYDFFYIDAFTDTQFAGNPCAVFPKADGLDEETMQKIARETNLNETAFVFPSSEADFRVRYFTPTYEIPFAGHPTIATAFLLAEEGYIPGGGESGKDENVLQVQFEFNVGVLPVEIVYRKGTLEKVGMQQKPPEFGAVYPPERIAPMFGIKAEELLENAPVQVVSTGVPFLMVPVKSVDVVKKAEMDRQELARLLKSSGVDAAFVCTPHGYTEKGTTFARLLGPESQSEDTFTGSASGCMGSFFYRHGIVKTDKMVLEQGHSLGRPGTGELVLTGTPENIERVQLYGAAAKSLKGTLELE
ncbi:MAG: PhzF family phenazine biosynthesis protein [Spirochaetia bacterium]